jgi:probable HAF family extracellular repeat protein
LYSVTGLEELPGSTRGSAAPGGLNNFGQVVGWADFAVFQGSLPQAFLWSEGVIKGLGFLRQGQHSRAHAINDRGLVVGRSNAISFPGPSHAFLWNELTGMEDLGTVSSVHLDTDSEVELFSVANAINNFGQVAGTSGVTGRAVPTTGCTWSRSNGMGAMRNLRQFSKANAINDHELVVGTSFTLAPDTSLSEDHAFVWSPNTGMEDLGTLPDHRFSVANAINNPGQVVGWSSNLHEGRAPAAFVWSPSTGMEDLGTLPDHRFSVANAINNSGQVVGGSFSPDSEESQEGSKHAFVWSPSTGMEDLNVLLPPDSGWELIEAHDINESGQILCRGLHTGPDDAQERRLCVLTRS